ncbi:uncharacterized protein BDR25DRAFT_214455 [Lindgomyces ingoldianus]|uniref:Uncharacterized protein n=1 Tax=Lindgomyces ingoldianus TaxID=673940 RepID=A0ACB6R6Q7_9PLEO|nr:uncharacterized protein BDR25DRAFT_214455 [Lindgomyces ingoldianus]KAF2474924.1 hypothetical protein BDR25DRAFT_214455 [Lindgomyces ingoldianus]
MDEIDKLEKCMQDLRLTDPRDDKKRIEETKGGLLEGSYRWILENSDFQRWRDDPQSRLLWIKGDPGKGKTMLLCGVVNYLKKSMAKTALLSYFFCQATDSRINNATAVLRGLLYLLVDQQPSLVSHIRKKHDHAGKALFKDANAWVALSEIFTNILQDPSLNSTYLIVDALDECVTDLPKLLDFIAQNLSVSSRIKWMVTSRNEAFIEQRLQLDDSGTRLSLELKENAAQVSWAVDSVLEKMQQKANGTFLWVSLVVKELKEVMTWEVLQVLEEVPTELKDVYRRMMKQIERLRRQYPELCRQVLSTVIAAYRPLRLQELHLLSGLPTQVQDVNQATTAIVKMCGSFLTIQEGSVYIIHQSARDFLSDEARHNIFPCGIGDVHHSIFSKSLQAMSKTLRRDMYSLRQLGYPAEYVKQPDPDPLAASRYSCVYWVDHLCNYHLSRSANRTSDLKDEGAINSFITKKFLYWLEALSLCKSIPHGVVAITRLETVVEGRIDTHALLELVRDARRFIMSHKWAIENSPLQAYTSALLFSPTRSLIRGLFKREEPGWIAIKQPMQDKWSPCLQTLEGHRDVVTSVAFSPDSARLASASGDKTTVKIWDASSSDCLQTLKGHSDSVISVAFSHNSARLASASDDNTVKIWDASSGDCLQTLSIGKRLYRISFDITDSYLRTEIGAIDIPARPGSLSLLTILEPRSPQYQGLALSADGAWITYNSEKLVWLPSEHRPSSSVVSRNIIGIGVGTGRVWICKVELT